jgi:large subunit ribosomal protein L25
MAQELSVDANSREDFGKNASRRLRHSGLIPAVVYGGGGPAIPVVVDSKKILQILRSESGHNAIFTLAMKGKAPARVMLREWQVDPVHGDLLHVDMVRVARDVKLKVKVPIQLTGEAAGVKVQGGILEVVLREVELECLPDNIPDHLTADVTELTVGRNLRVADLPVSDKVKVLTDPASVVAHVVVIKEEEEKPAVEAEAAAPAEPEVIRKGKAEVEEEPEEAEAGEAKETKKEAKKETKKES